MPRSSLAPPCVLFLQSSCLLRLTATIRFRFAVTLLHRTPVKVFCPRIFKSPDPGKNTRKPRNCRHPYEVSNVNSSGTVYRSTARSWPNAVRIRAELWKCTSNCLAGLVGIFFSNPSKIEFTRNRCTEVYSQAPVIDNLSLVPPVPPYHVAPGISRVAARPIARLWLLPPLPTPIPRIARM